jgi:Ca2+-transporting ATPase
MLGHVFLALNFRSDREPLSKQGPLSNKLMVLWALIVVFSLIMATGLPVLHDALKITSLSLADWAIVLSVSFFATFWMEFKKILKPRR